MFLHLSSLNFLRRIVRSEDLVYNSFFFRTAVSRKLFDIRLSYKLCILTWLPTRQDDFQNRDKVCYRYAYLFNARNVS